MTKFGYFSILIRSKRYIRFTFCLSLLKWSCWFQCVWIWNLLLSLLWLKCKYCITTQKTVCLAILGKIIDVVWHKNVCFYVVIDKFARSWSYGSFSDSYLFFFDQIYHKTHFYTILGSEKYSFVELILFSKFSIFALFSVSFMDFLKLWMLWILFWKCRSFY